jgi:hypothetical protein
MSLIEAKGRKTHVVVTGFAVGTNSAGFSRFESDSLSNFEVLDVTADYSPTRNELMLACSRQTKHRSLRFVTIAAVS